MCRYLAICNSHVWHHQKQISLIPAISNLHFAKQIEKKQSIDRAPPPCISTQSICVYHAIWLPIVCCPQAGFLFFSPLLFPSFLLPHSFGDPSAYLPYHAAKPSIYAPICLSNYILAFICLTISLFTHSPANHVACSACCGYQCSFGCYCL